MPISFRRVSFEWPNGTSVFQNLNCVIKDHRTGLVGTNGVGKTTLVHLAAGRLQLTSGAMEASRPVCLFSQIADERSDDEPAALKLALLEAFESDVARRLLEKVPIERPTSSFSGGEWMKFRLASLAAVARGKFVILDEPTNHLDREGRAAVIEFVRSWTDGLLVVSHDRELLENVDEIIELTPQGISRVGGAWSEYEEFRNAERDRLGHDLADAKRERAKAESERSRKLAQQEKRMAKGRQVRLKGGQPRIVMNAYKSQAQATEGRIDRSTLAAAEEAVTQIHEAFRALKIDPVLAIQSIDLTKKDVPSDRLLAEASELNIRFKGGEWLWREPISFQWRGPCRVAIRGANGSGKSTLLNILFTEDSVHNFVDMVGEVRRGPLQAAFLRQDALVNTEASIFELLRETSGLDEVELRNQLARFLFHRGLAEQPISLLSGGERLRAALAQALIGARPQALILDEPTNNLDLANIEYLEEFLRHFPGALVVISHDERFLKAIEIDEYLNIS